MAKRRKIAVPLMLFWNKRDQRRFIDAVERLCSVGNDLAMVRTLFEETLDRMQPKVKRSKRAVAAELDHQVESEVPL